MKLIALGLLLVFVGILITIVGAFSMAYQGWKASGERPHVKGGGVIMVGPIPIAFGTDIGAVKVAMVLAFALMAIAVILMVVGPKAF